MKCALRCNSQRKLCSLPLLKLLNSSSACDPPRHAGRPYLHDSNLPARPLLSTGDVRGAAGVCLCGVLVCASSVARLCDFYTELATVQGWLGGGLTGCGWLTGGGYWWESSPACLAYPLLLYHSFIP